MAARAPLFLLACGSFNPITHQHMRLFELARDQMRQTGLYHVVGGIVSPVSDGYGKQGLVASKHRLAMARLALQSSDWVTVDDWESQQSDWTETVVTMRSQRREYEMPVIYPHLAVGDFVCKRRSFQNDVRFSFCIPQEMAKYHYDRIAARYQRRTGERKDPPTDRQPASSPQLKLLCGADFIDAFKVPGLWRDDHIEEVVGRFGLVCVSRGSLQPDRTIHESDMLSRHRRNIFLIQEWVQNEISATEVRRALRRGRSVKYLIPDSVIEYIKENNLYTQDSEMNNKEIQLRPLTKQTIQD